MINNNIPNSSDSMPQTGQIRANTHRLPLIAITIVSTFLGTITIFARFWVRTFLNKKRGYDDYTMYVAWVFSIGFTACLSLGIVNGVGKFNAEISSDQVIHIVLMDFFLEILYYIAIYLIKISILIFYLRLSAVLRNKFFYMSTALIVVLTVQLIPTLIISFIQCRPSHFFWHTPVVGKCIKVMPYYFENCIFGIVADVAILALPINLLLNTINLNKRTRLGLIGIFLAGILCTICSCARLYSLALYAHKSEALYNAATIASWSAMEINLGIVGACGPSLHQLFGHVKSKIISSQKSNTDSTSPVLTDGTILEPKEGDNCFGEAKRKDGVGTRLKLDPRGAVAETICSRGSVSPMAYMDDSTVESDRITVSTLVLISSLERSYSETEWHNSQSHGGYLAGEIV